MRTETTDRGEKAICPKCGHDEFRINEYAKLNSVKVAEGIGNAICDNCLEPQEFDINF